MIDRERAIPIAARIIGEWCMAREASKRETLEAAASRLVDLILALAKDRIVQRTVEKRDGSQGGKSVKVTDEPVPITDEMVERAADAMPHHEGMSYWTEPVQREILRRALDAAINGEFK